MTQFQGTADVNMGRGAIVIGLAAIIIGEVLLRRDLPQGLQLLRALLFVVLGGVLYYLVMVLILWLQARPERSQALHGADRGAFLAVPYLQEQAKSSFSRAEKARTEGGESDNDADVNHISKTFNPGTINETRALAGVDCT